MDILNTEPYQQLLGTTVDKITTIMHDLEISEFTMINFLVEQLILKHKIKNSWAWATYVKNIELLRFIINKNPIIDPNILLMEAINHGDISLIMYAINVGANVNHIVTNHKDGTLFYMCSYNIKSNGIDNMKILLDHGANAHNQNVMDMCIRCGFINVIELLMVYGANINNSHNMLIAVDYKQIEIVSLLLDHGTPLTDPKLIPLVVKVNSLDILKLLVNHGAQLTDPTLLSLAINNNSLEMITFLIDHNVTFLPTTCKRKKIIDTLVNANIDPILIAYAYATQSEKN